MARFDPPSKFSFIADDWKDWIAEYQRYRRAVKLYADDGADQRDQLLYAMGVKEAEKIFKTLQFKEVKRTAADGSEETHQESDTDFDCLVQKFTNHFVPMVNIRYERRKFNERIQSKDESVEAFVRALYSLATTCKYTDEDDMILDRLIAGLKDTRVRAKLQMDPSITLEKAIRIARNHELVLHQEGESLKAEANVQEVRRKKKEWSNQRSHGGPKHSGGGRSPSHFNKSTASTSTNPPQSQQSCGRCGKDHGGERCPAIGRTCGYCKKRGHFISVCRKKQSRDRGAREVEETDELFYIGAVTCPDGGPAWETKLPVCGKSVTFKIDTGADVTVISEDIFRSMRTRPQLRVSRTKLTSPGGQLNTLGEFIAESVVKGVRYQFRIVVVDRLKNSLLGRSVAEKMGLVARVEEVKDVYGTSGLMTTEPVKITLKPDAVPYCVTTCRRIPFPLMEKVKAELTRMSESGIIEKVTRPTDWCAPMVPVVKRNKDIRICADFKKLNVHIKRPHLMLPNLEDIAPKLAGATVFSTLDISSGFYQVPLNKDSRYLTTFMTPMGRYCFCRLPMGINIGPEEFQRKMLETFGSLDGCECIMDDLLVYGKTKEEHDGRLQRVMAVARQTGVKLNEAKCHLGRREVSYFGHLVSSQGIRPSKEKIAAIVNMPAPSNVTELRSLLGMINFLGKFVNNLATVAKPMSDLLKSDSVWQWDTPQKQALDKVKVMVSSVPALAFYRPNLKTIVSADASSYGLGAALLQEENGQVRPVAYCSRTLTEAEKRYAQIEKEGLASVWACEKLAKYLIGLPTFELWTDHKPLVPLLTTKDLDQAPIRCQRLLLRMMRFSPEVRHIPGKELVIADALSRNPVPHTASDERSADEVQLSIDAIQALWPASRERLHDIMEATSRDAVLTQVKLYIQKGWPREVADDIKPYRESQIHLSIMEGIITYGDRIVIPTCMRKEMLNKLHESHQGISKCREKANRCIWWPGMSKEIGLLISNCEICQRQRDAQKHEPLIPTELPSRPWAIVAADLCEEKGKHYLVMVDLYSRWIEIKFLSTTSAHAVISRMKDVLATHGVMDELISDNGPQFASSEFATFVKSYGFTHRTSSPYFAQANGEAENSVKMAKKLLTQEDPHLAILNYRTSTHSAIGVSPSEALMGRQLQTRLPVLAKNLLPTATDHDAIRQSDQKAKASYKYYYDRRHGTTKLTTLAPGEPVLIKSVGKGWDKAGRIVEANERDRTYMVATPAGTFRRNRQHLQAVPRMPTQQTRNPEPVINEDQPEENTDPPDPVPSDVEVQRTPTPVPVRRSSRQTAKPKRLIEEC